ncbi:gamma-glutamyltranspeptidase/glutathione hydrolase [Kineosphaera limosa]|uniref:Glutathione hydrolase proenzyme n=1 Tax=Kineosphaera limosa NBRC 100340 TaxID=1184609 RepID=K6VDP3_9MICO|nr:gamma-glutamyltransferase [Kineosphaera limosa]NYE02858.1 gamma-glutamyltranspeptidase/glutathione hydrolase [Kineosphaera limosa]GAB94288.1 gamma-glutamyltranspeptidase [Kineosphaera limosa NBRC 100340]
MTPETQVPSRRRAARLGAFSLALALPLGLGGLAAHAAPAAPAAPGLAPATADASATGAQAGPDKDSVQDAHGRHGPKPVGHKLPKVATMTGSGGAVASVDPVASQVGIDVLKAGGNAADAAVATAAALGVTEPYANGIGGGGFFVYYDAKSQQVSTLDGRETAPAGMHEKSFLEPDGKPMEFWKAVNSGLSVGVPGTPATWQAALDRWGSRSFSQLLAPAQKIAERGFVVDDSFAQATADNAERFAKFPATAQIFLPGGEPVVPGQVLRQPDLAKAYAALREHGPAAFTSGPLADAMVQTVQHPKTAEGVSVPAGTMTHADLRAYQVLAKDPIHSTYRGYDVYAMGLPSSGGIAVGSTLNLLEQYEKRTGTTVNDADQAAYLHAFAEATATAFADRNRWVGDVPGVPVAELISKGFAAERACGFDPAKAQQRPIAFGEPDGEYGPCAAPGEGGGGAPNDGAATTHLTTSDKWGNVASYTLTIEQFGGSGMVVPGWGFLLNNEMTDFEFEPMTQGVPALNLPAPGKRPRSSMAPTIVLKDGKPVVAVGAAGGATIITTTAQILTGYLDRDLSLVKAVAADRISSRNTATTAEPSLIVSDDGKKLIDSGHELTPAAAIGRATAIAFKDGKAIPAAETSRGGGGSAMVVKRDRR